MCACVVACCFSCVLACLRANVLCAGVLACIHGCMQTCLRAELLAHLRLSVLMFLRACRLSNFRAGVLGWRNVCLTWPALFCLPDLAWLDLPE
jgi:hypothetical protein